jgi:hypothetical protein
MTQGTIFRDCQLPYRVQMRLRISFWFFEGFVWRFGPRGAVMVCIFTTVTTTITMGIAKHGGRF